MANRFARFVEPAPTTNRFARFAVPEPVAEPSQNRFAQFVDPVGEMPEPIKLRDPIAERQAELVTAAMEDYTRTREGVDRLNAEAAAAGIPLGRAVRWKRQQLASEFARGEGQLAPRAGVDLGDIDASSSEARARAIAFADEIQSSPSAGWPGGGGAGEDGRLSGALDEIEQFRQRTMPEVPGDQLMGRLGARAPRSMAAPEPGDESAMRQYHSQFGGDEPYEQFRNRVESGWVPPTAQTQRQAAPVTGYDIGAATIASGGQLLKGLGGAGRMAGESLEAAQRYLTGRSRLEAGSITESVTGAIKDMGLGVFDTGAEMEQSVAGQLMTRPTDGDPLSMLKYWTQQAQVSAPTMAAAAVGYRISPKLGSSIMFGTAAGNEYGASRDEGQDVQSSFTDAVVSGLAEAVPERMAFDKIFAPTAKAIGQSAASRFFGAIAARTGRGAGLEEGVEQATRFGKRLGAGASRGAAVEPLSEIVTEAANIAYEAYQGEPITFEEFATRLIDAGAVGAVMGGGLGAGANVGPAWQDRRADPALDEQLEYNSEGLRASIRPARDTTRRILGDVDPTSPAGQGAAAADVAFSQARQQRGLDASFKPIDAPAPTGINFNPETNAWLSAPEAPAAQPFQLPTAAPVSLMGAPAPDSVTVSRNRRMRQEVPNWQPEVAAPAVAPEQPMLRPRAVVEAERAEQAPQLEARQQELEQRLAEFRAQTRPATPQADRDAAEEGVSPLVDFYAEGDQNRIKKSTDDGMIDFDFDAEEAAYEAGKKPGTKPEAPEFAPSGRQYGTAPEDALTDWVVVKPGERVAMGNEVADAFLGIASASPRAFQMPQIPDEARTLEDIASAVDSDIVIRRQTQGVPASRAGGPPIVARYTLTLPDGAEARLDVEQGGGLQFDAQALEEGSGGGAPVYAIINTFAQRNGFKALPDRLGLTEINKTRRTEQQAASAIRTRSTQHLAPDVTQTVANFEVGGNDRQNTGALLIKGMLNTLQAVPELHQLRYNSEAGQFEWTNGEIADDADFSRLAGTPAAREIGAGRSTLKRAVIAATAVRETRRNGPGSGKVLGDVGGQSFQQLATSALEGLLYSRAGVDGIPAPAGDRGRPGVGRDQGRTGSAARPTQQGNARPVAGARSVDDVYAELTKTRGGRFVRGLKAQATKPGGWLKIVQSRAEIPDQWRRQLKPTERVGGFVTPTGEVYVVADEIVGDATGLVMHELGVHYGMRQALGDQFDSILKAFEGRRGEDRAVEAAFARVPKDTPAADVVEEALAYYVQDNWTERPPLWRRIMDAISQFLSRETGLSAAVINGDPQALVQFAQGAAERAARGEFQPQQDQAEDGAVAFSRKAPNWDEFARLGGLVNAFEVTKARVFQTGRDLKLALQDAMTAATNPARIDLSVETPETVRHLTRMAVADARQALKSNANAVGWYDTKVSQALEVLALVHPEIKTDPEAEFAFIFALAVTSNGLKVGKNFELAERAYRTWRETGKMPTDIGIGTVAGPINEGLALFNEKVAEFTWQPFRDFMVAETTVKQIKAAGGDVSGEHADTTVRGAAILGPKIGNGFFSNLYGYFDALTMDRWLMRTWGRWTGNLIEYDPDAVKTKNQKLTTLLGMLSARDKRQLLQLVGARASWNTKAIAAAITDASADKKTREALNAIGVLSADDQAALTYLLGKAKKGQARESLGSEIRKMGNVLTKAIDGQKEAPANGTERNFIRKVFGAALTELRADYPGLTMADLQALLWYPEKRLYDSAKQKDDADEGYNDDEAPDYANAAVGLARAAGVPQEKLTEALDEAAKRTRAGGRGAAGGQSAQSAPASNEPVGPSDTPARLLFEVAPDPNDAGLKARWDRLSGPAKARISLAIAELIAPKALDQAEAARAEVQTQIGGYLDDSNPSLALVFNGRADLARVVQAARVLGFALSQDSMMVLASKPFEGSFETGLITVQLPEGQTDQTAVHEVYKRLRALDPDSIQGHTTVGREMVLAVPADALTRLKQAAISELGSDFTVYDAVGQMAFPSKEDYDYGDRRGQAASELSDGGQGARDLRAEASRLLDEALGQEAAESGRAGSDRDALGGEAPQAESQGVAPPTFSSRKPHKQAVSAVGIHYGPAGLKKLDPTMAGTGAAGAERYRFGVGRFGKFYPRVNFYVREPGAGVPPSEQVVGGSESYHVELTNLYDFMTDPLGLVEANSRNMDALEGEITDAGFDGLLFPPHPNIPVRTAIVFGFTKKIPAVPVPAGEPVLELKYSRQRVDEQPRDELGRFEPMGPDKLPRIPKPERQLDTSTKNAVMREERELLLKDPVFSALPSRTHKDIIAKAAERIVGYPRAALDLARRLSAGLETRISEDMEALLLVGKVQLMRERKELARKAFHGNYSDEVKAAAKARWDELEEAMNELDTATATTGSIWGRFGNLRQRIIKEDFSLENMLDRATKAKGKSLSTEEAAQIARQAEQIESMEKELEQVKEDLALREARAYSEAMLADMVVKTARYLQTETKARSRPFLDHLRAMAEESKAALAQMPQSTVNRPGARGQSGAVDVARIYHLGRIAIHELAQMGYNGVDWSRAQTHAWRVRMRHALGSRKFRYADEQGLMPSLLKHARSDLDVMEAAKRESFEAAKKRIAELGTDDLTHRDVYELVLGLVTAGTHGEAAVMRQATELLREKSPDITERDVRRLFVEYGKVTFPNPDAVKKEVRELRELVRLQESIDRIEEGLPALKNGPQRDKATADVREKRARLAELLKVMEVKGAADPERLATYQDARINNLKHQIEDLTRQLATGERPEKRTPPPATPEMLKLIAQRDALREDIRKADKQPKQKDAAAEALRQQQRREADLNKQIAELEARIAGKPASKLVKPDGPQSPLEIRRDNLREQLKALERAKKTRMSAAERINRARLSGLNRQIEILEEELLTTLRRPKSMPPPPSSEVEAKAKLRDELKAQVKALRESQAPPPKTEDEKYQDRTTKALERQIAKIQDKLAREDYAKPAKVDRTMNAQNVQLKHDLQRLKHAFAVKVFELEMANRKLPARIGGAVVETFNIMRSIITSIDVSAVLRQSLFTFGHPVLAAKLFLPMLHAGWSAAENTRQEDAIRDRPNFQLYEKAGLNLTHSNGIDPRRVEEQFVGRWLDKLDTKPGERGKNFARNVHRVATAPVRASGRAYSAFTNHMRVEMFDLLAQTLINNPTAPTLDELKSVANLVNVFTGRGTFGKHVDAGGQALSLLLFAPRYVASRFNVVTLQPVWKAWNTSPEGTKKRVARMVAKEYAKTILGMGAIYALYGLYAAVMGDDDDEIAITLDPRSSDFGKLRFGDTWLDPLAGLGQVATVMARSMPFVGGTVVDGEFQSLGPDRGWGKRGVWDVWGAFLRSKLSPMAATTANVLTGETYGGMPTTAEDQFWDLVLPLTWREVGNITEDRGMGEGLALLGLSAMGMGLQYRDPDHWDEVKAAKAEYMEGRNR